MGHRVSHRNSHFCVGAIIDTGQELISVQFEELTQYIASTEVSLSVKRGNDETVIISLA